MLSVQSKSFTFEQKLHYNLGLGDSMSIIKIAAKLLLFLAIFGLAGCSNAGNLNLSQMIINIADTMPSVMAMVTALSYIIGIALATKGVYKLREYGELRTMMSSQTSLWPIILNLFCGFSLVYFPSTFDMGMFTMFGYDNPLTYTGASDQQTTELVNAMVDIMQVIGAIAVIRGFMILNTSMQQGSQPGSFSKGITFVVGGILAINMYGTWDMLVNTITG